jgi:hypothetical protein
MKKDLKQDGDREQLVVLRNAVIDDIVLAHQIVLNPIDRGNIPLPLDYSPLPLPLRKMVLYLTKLQKDQPNMRLVTFNYDDAEDWFHLPHITSADRKESKQLLTRLLIQASYLIYPSHEDWVEHLPLHRLRQFAAVSFVTQEAKKVLNLFAKRMLENTTLVEVSPYLGVAAQLGIPKGMFLLEHDAVFKTAYRLMIQTQIHSRFNTNYDSVAATRTYNKYFHDVINIDILFKDTNFQKSEWCERHGVIGGFYEALEMLKPFFQMSLCHGIANDTQHYLPSTEEYDGLAGSPKIENLLRKITLEKLVKYKLFFNLIM